MNDTPAGNGPAAPVPPVAPDVPPQSPPPPLISSGAPAPDTGKKLRSILSTLAILLLAPLIAILLTAFVFQSYQVDGPSMQSTLQNNDRLIVWKWPRTVARITGHQYVPRRGDIVIFVGGQQLAALGQDASKQLIKRVIALPGESVLVKNGTVTVFNKAHPRGFRPDTTMPYGKVIGDTELESTVASTPLTLGKDEVFVMGDNRPDSLDSRAFGPVKLKNIVGKLSLRVLPIDQARRF